MNYKRYVENAEKGGAVLKCGRDLKIKIYILKHIYKKNTWVFSGNGGVFIMTARRDEFWSLI